jgi:hypothetical protein
MHLAACSNDDGIGLALLVILCTVWVAENLGIVHGPQRQSTQRNKYHYRKTLLINLLLIVNRDLEL